MALMVELLLAALLAALFSTVLAFLITPPPVERHRPAWLLLFVVLLGVIWAGGAWLIPIGPPAWGVHWLGFVIVALLVAILLAAVYPSHSPSGPEQRAESAQIAGAATTIFGLFFWILVIALALSILAAYLA